MGFWMVGGMGLRVGHRVFSAALLAAALAACGQNQSPAGDAGGPGLSASQRPAMTEEDLKAQSAALLAKLGAPADAATRKKYEGAFDAVGAEPDWQLTFLPDYVAFTRPGLEEINAIPSARDYRALGVYTQAGPLAIAIVAGACTYGDGGESYPFSATVLYDGIAYEGCARVGADGAAAPVGVSRGWASDLSQLLPAIDACIARAAAKPARVTIAYVNEENQAAVRVLEADGGRSECLASLDGSSIINVLPLTDRDTFRNERDPLFTRAPANPPSGACYTSEELKGSSGATLGWLSRRVC
jgi:uncharacterized membrane protein